MTTKAMTRTRWIGRRSTARAFMVVVALATPVPRGARGQAVTDVNPDGNPAEPRFGGRCLGLTVSPTNASNVWVASEKGGFFTSTNGGTNWTHIDAIPFPLARDVVADPQNASIVIASGQYDLRTANQGGIYRSIDGGATWSKPAGSNPACTTQASTWGIAIPDDPAFHQNVYVGTDCGIAISPDSGATWSHVDPCTAADAAFCSAQKIYYDVQARVVGGRVQLDVCGDEGYFRSPDGGTTWSAPDPSSPARQVNGGAFNPCNVATAPGDPNTVLLTNYSGVVGGFCQARLMENDAGGAAGMWVDMNVGAQNCRDPWVVTHPDLGGAANLFQVYVGDSQRMRVQSCNTNNTPRCMAGVANWPTGDSGSHADTSDIDFDHATPNGCPVVLSSDGGNATSTNCGMTWQDGNRGLHALDVATFAGTVEGGGVTDLYAGTQDNGIYVTQNNAATWTRPVGADGYNVLADRAPPVRVFYRVCFGCGDSIANAGITGAAAFMDPPGNISTFAVADQFGPKSYVFLTNDGGMPAQWTAYVTTDEGATWKQLGPSPLPGSPGEVKASGPAASPTFYLRLNVGGQRRIYSLSGALDSTAALTLANAGLSIPWNAWDVDRSNPMFLYANDIGTNQVMFSTNGGASWAPDTALTNLITAGGTFRFSGNIGAQVTGIGIDPNSQRILVGTFTAGWFFTANDGQSWFPVPGAQLLSNAQRFFFDQDTGQMYGATRGRGIWRIDVPIADLAIAKDDMPDAVAPGDALTYVVTVTNNGPQDALGIVVTDVLPPEVTFVSDTDACVQSPPGTLTCSIGNLAPGGSTSFQITVTVDPTLVAAACEPVFITNKASVASFSTDPDPSNNQTSLDTRIVFPLDHFQCYETDQLRLPRITGLSLDDQFGAGTVEVRRLRRFCNPADKNGEDPTAPLDPCHLAGYEIRQDSPRFLKRRGVTVTNQFGVFTVEVRRPLLMLVPTAKGLAGPPPTLVKPTLDHFKCYEVKGAHTRLHGVMVEDEFAPLEALILKPYRLCMAADKEGEGIQMPDAHLMCYKSRLEPSRPHPDPFFISNQFHDLEIELTGARELCVPSTVM